MEINEFCAYETKQYVTSKVVYFYFKVQPNLKTPLTPFEYSLDLEESKMMVNLNEITLITLSHYHRVFQFNSLKHSCKNQSLILNLKYFLATKAYFGPWCFLVQPINYPEKGKYKLCIKYYMPST